jgi:hypothetical protein
MLVFCRRLLPALALLPLGGAAAARAQLPGPLATNLTFNSIQPCRIIDTRLAGGALSPGVNRMFNVVGVSAIGSLDSQGGNHNGCPIPGFSGGPTSLGTVQAVAVNLIAVGATGPGDLLAWPTDQPQPSASVINYASAEDLGGLNIANGIILPVRQDSPGADITVKAQVAGTHLVADVVGYFSKGNGSDNVYLGPLAGNPSQSSSFANSAFGYSALGQNTSGDQNAAFGLDALGANTQGSYNAAFGGGAMNSNVSGSDNTALGSGALGNLKTGILNVVVGFGGGVNYMGNESSNILIGNGGSVGESNSIHIGNQCCGDGTQNATFIAGIWGTTISNGMAVSIDDSGQLGIATSALRFKEDVTDMGAASVDLMRLRPVTFHYRSAYDDGSRLLQYGLIAEEVAQVYPGLVQYDAGGQPLAVRYQFVDVMLLNEVQRQHREIAELREQLAKQEERLKSLEARPQ